MSEAQLGGEIYEYLVKHLAELGYHPHISWELVHRDVLIQSIATSRLLTLTNELRAPSGTKIKVGLWRRRIARFHRSWPAILLRAAALRELRLGKSAVPNAAK